MLSLKEFFDKKGKSNPPKRSSVPQKYGWKRQTSYEEDMETFTHPKHPRHHIDIHHDDDTFSHTSYSDDNYSIMGKKTHKRAGVDHLEDHLKKFHGKD